MIVSDYISIGAVCVSVISIIVSIFLFNNQKKYIKTQDELNKLLLNKEKKEVESTDEALVSANVVRMGSKNYRIRVFNKGKGQANNVNISYFEQNNWMIMNNILPIEFIKSGQSVDLILALHMNTQSKVKAILTWEDKKGSKENIVILTC